MDAKIIHAIENTHGRFMQYYNLNKADLSAKQLFADTKDVRLWMPDKNIDAVGLKAIDDTLSSISAQRAKGGRKRDIHLTHCPVFKISDDKKTAYGTWDTYSFDIKPGADGKWAVEFYTSRMDASFIKQDGTWKYRNLDWYEIVSFMPWKALAKDDVHADEASLPLPPEPTGVKSTKDYLEIQKLQARFSHDNRRNAMGLFADRDDITFRMANLFEGTVKGREKIREQLRRLDEMEALNGGNYLCVPLITAPVIEIGTDRRTACGTWLVMTYEVKAGAFGMKDLPYKIVRRLGYLNQTFVKEGKDWKILDFDLEILFSQTPFDYDPVHVNTRYHRMTQRDNKWRYSLPQMGGVFPDDAIDVEIKLPYWLNALRRGELEGYIRNHMYNEVREIIFDSKFTGKEAPPVVGLDSMLKKFTGLPFQYHHQQVCYHTDTTPIIEISKDGTRATALYFDQSWTPYDDNTNTDTSANLVFDSEWSADKVTHKKVKSISLLSKYEHEFVKVDGQWKHVTLTWEPIICFPDWELAGAASRGWSGADTDEKYPKLWEKYKYCPKRKL